MKQYRCLVPVACAGTVRPIDSIVDYDGPPAWYLEPLDPKDRAEWGHKTAKPKKAAEERAKHLGYPDFDFFREHPHRTKAEAPRAITNETYNFFGNHPGRVTERRT